MKNFDSGQILGALLTNPSKAFDCFNHKLMIAKLNTFSFRLPALKLIHDYLSNRKQRTKVSRIYSSCLQTVSGLQQGFIFGSFLFNTYLPDLFFILNNVYVVSYADVNTSYVGADDINGVLASLEKTSTTLFEWFQNNSLESNAEKCHLSFYNSSIKVSVYDIKSSEYEKFLCFKFDNKLIFEKTHH